MAAMAFLKAAMQEGNKSLSSRVLFIACLSMAMVASGFVDFYSSGLIDCSKKKTHHQLDMFGDFGRLFTSSCQTVSKLSLVWVQECDPVLQ